MSAINDRALLAACGLVVSSLLMVGLPATADAAAAPSHVQTVERSAARPGAVADPHFACGYDGYNGSNGNQPLYTHCGNGDVVIQVDHFFWGTTYACVHPGTQEIPQGDNQWRIYSAEWDGNICSIPGPVVGP